MSAIPIYGDPSQEADRKTPEISWWHISIGIKKTLFLYKQILEDAEIWLIRDWGVDRPGDGIAMRWQTRNGPYDRIKLRCGEINLVPIALREPIGSSGTYRTLITNENFLNDVINQYKWRLDMGTYGFWLELRVGEYRRRSDRRYVIHVPDETGSNDGFFIQ